MTTVSRLVLCLSLIYGGWLVACHTGPKSAQSLTAEANSLSKPESTPAREQAGNSDKELIKLVNQFASSGNEADAAWKQFQSYPRQELITSLLRLQQSLAADDRQRVLISFALCNLNYEYEKNRAVVVSSLSEQTHYKDFDAEWAASLLESLMKRGDKNVLPSLFSVAPRSDGSFAEELGGVYLNAWHSDPKEFLMGLKSVPIKARRSVYFLLLNDELLTDADTTKMKAYLRSAEHDSAIGRIAKEMLTAIPRLEEERKRNQE